MSIDAQEEIAGVSSGWIEWKAEDQLGCPVAPDDLVDVICWGKAHYCEEADSWSWADCDTPITYYRYHDGTNPTPPGSDAWMVAELVAALRIAEECMASFGADDDELSTVRDAIRKAEMRQGKTVPPVIQTQDKEA